MDQPTCGHVDLGVAYTAESAAVRCGATPVLVLDINRLSLMGVFEAANATGCLQWEGSQPPRATANFSWQADESRGGRLDVNSGAASSEWRARFRARIDVELSSSGRRWFRCPVGNRGRNCRGRAAKLFIDLAAGRLGCGACQAMHNRLRRTETPTRLQLVRAVFGRAKVRRDKQSEARLGTTDAPTQMASGSNRRQI